MSNYEAYLDAVVDQIFDMAANRIGWSWYELAQMSGLSYTTVHRLGNRVTRFPQLRTVFQLAQAVNMDLPVIKRNLRKLERVNG